MTLDPDTSYDMYVEEKGYNEDIQINIQNSAGIVLKLTKRDIIRDMLWMLLTDVTKLEIFIKN